MKEKGQLEDKEEERINTIIHNAQFKRTGTPISGKKVLKVTSRSINIIISGYNKVVYLCMTCIDCRSRGQLQITVHNLV